MKIKLKVRKKSEFENMTIKTIDCEERPRDVRNSSEMVHLYIIYNWVLAEFKPFGE